MNRITFFTLILIFASFASQGVAQNPSTTDVEKSLNVQEFKRLEYERAQRVAAYAQANNIPIRSYDENGELVVLDDVDIFGEPVFTAVYNLGGVETIGANHLYSGGGLGLSLTGAGIDAGIWDGGYVRPDHIDLINRILQLDGNTGISGHGTHVGGTIIGDGSGDSRNRGVAFGGVLASYDFGNDVNEIRTEAQSGMLVSNHSYGRALNPPSTQNNAIFGKYDALANLFDDITFQSPYLLPVVSAGNDRGAQPGGIYNSRDNGYDILTDRSLSKNSLTVAAVNNVSNYTGPNSVQMSTFSSWGPADDGRIKPDISAKGVGVVSTDVSSANPNNTSFYGIRSGTSMSSPMVTGGIMLLQELANTPGVFDNYLKSASMRALILSTAREAGSSPGPDARFGWGLMDVEAAASFLQQLGSTTELRETTINSSANSFTLTYTSNQPKLTIAIAWADRPGGVNTNTREDDRRADLINNLNLKVTDSNGNDFYPWRLNAVRPSSPATRGVNDVDNIEIVEIDNPSGNYTVTVTWDGTRTGSTQDFSLLVNGVDVGTLNLENTLNLADSIKIFPNPARDFVNISINGQLSGDRVNVTVFDALGKSVLDSSYNNSSNFNERLDVSQLNSGLYLVKISDGVSSTTKKLVVR